MPNVNITYCDFTIACWIRPSFKRTTQTIMVVSLATGKVLSLSITYVEAKSFLYALLDSDTLPFPLVHAVAFTQFNTWNHIAVTCDRQLYDVRVFVNGKLRPWNDPLHHFSRGRATLKRYFIGHSFLKGDANQYGQFFGSAVDLYIVGFALPPDDISNLFKGEQFVIIDFSYV